VCTEILGIVSTHGYLRSRHMCQVPLSGGEAYLFPPWLQELQQSLHEYIHTMRVSGCQGKAYTSAQWRSPQAPGCLQSPLPCCRCLSRMNWRRHPPSSPPRHLRSAGTLPVSTLIHCPAHDKGSVQGRCPCCFLPAQDKRPRRSTLQSSSPLGICRDPASINSNPLSRTRQRQPARSLSLLLFVCPGQVAPHIHPPAILAT
jgi:hypothetical protein